jgi:hypothetical protein
MKSFITFVNAQGRITDHRQVGKYHLDLSAFDHQRVRSAAWPCNHTFAPQAQEAAKAACTQGIFHCIVVPQQQEQEQEQEPSQRVEEEAQQAGAQSQSQVPEAEAERKSVLHAASDSGRARCIRPFLYLIRNQFSERRKKRGKHVRTYKSNSRSRTVRLLRSA